MPPVARAALILGHPFLDIPKSGNFAMVPRISRARQSLKRASAKAGHSRSVVAPKPSGARPERARVVEEVKLGAGVVEAQEGERVVRRERRGWGSDVSQGGPRVCVGGLPEEVLQAVPSKGGAVVVMVVVVVGVAVVGLEGGEGDVLPHLLHDPKMGSGSGGGRGMEEEEEEEAGRGGERAD